MFFPVYLPFPKHSCSDSIFLSYLSSSLLSSRFPSSYHTEYVENLEDFLRFHRKLDWTDEQRTLKIFNTLLFLFFLTLLTCLFLPVNFFYWVLGSLVIFSRNPVFVGLMNALSEHGDWYYERIANIVWRRFGMNPTTVSSTTTRTTTTFINAHTNESNCCLKKVR